MHPVRRSGAVDCHQILAPDLIRHAVLPEHRHAAADLFDQTAVPVLGVHGKTVVIVGIRVTEHHADRVILARGEPYAQLVSIQDSAPATQTPSFSGAAAERSPS
jgi:hypothetical protein